MDIKDAIQKKSELEENIFALVEEYENDTGCHVDRLYVSKHTVEQSSEPKAFGITATVEL